MTTRLTDATPDTRVPEQPTPIFVASWDGAVGLPAQRRTRYAVVAIPVIWLAFMMSLAVHVGALWQWWLRMPPITHASAEPGDDDRAPLVARLEAPAEPSPAVPPAPSVAPAPVKPTTVPPKPSRRQARPVAPLVSPPIARATPPAAASTPEISAAAPSPIPAPAPRPPRPDPVVTPPATPPPVDLAAFIAERRRARGEPDPPMSASEAAESAARADLARRDRIVAANLASVNTRDFGAGQRNSGGVFQITRLGLSDAEFTFFGWNKDIQRRASQRIEVRQGTDSDIQHAVVREMIAIVRRYESDDFEWDSHRLGRQITLSARAADTPDLEAFLLREFFDATALRR